MNQILKDFGIFSIVTVEIVGFTGGGLWLGYWLSERHGFPSWTLAVTAIAGLVIAIFRIYRMVKRRGAET